MTRIRAAFIALLIASVAFAAYGDKISGNGPEFLPRDPGAIRASGGGPEAHWIDFLHEEDAPAYAEGRVFWDKDNECLAFYPEQPDTIMQLGQEMWCRVKNEEVATMTNGTVVYLSPPNTGNDPVAKLADANTATQSTVIGVVTHDISPDSSGYVTVSGLVRNLNTSGMVEGGKVFLSETPGSFTATLPAAPATSLVVGYVLKAHESAGLLFVRVWLNGSIEPAMFHNTSYFAGASTFTSGINANAITCDAVDGVDVSAHVASAGVHGVTQVANAADYLRLDGTATMTSEIVFGGAYGVKVSSTSYQLTFKQATTERARFAPDTGNLLINTTTDDGTSKLQVSGQVSITDAIKMANSKYLYGKTSGGADVVLAGVTSGDLVVLAQATTNTLIQSNGHLKLGSIPTYADNAAAISGGLAAGEVYRTSTGVLMIVY